MSRLNVGLIGYGHAGSVFHGPLVLSEPRMQLTCVATSRSLSSEYAGVRTETDPSALIAAGDVDLVVIATPNGSHLPLARAALEAGKHVVVDKPFTINLADAETLVSLAAENRCLLSVFQNRRWDGNFLTVRELLEKGRNRGGAPLPWASRAGAKPRRRAPAFFMIWGRISLIRPSVSSACRRR